MMKGHVLDIVCQRMMTSHARCVKAAGCVVGMMIKRLPQQLVYHGNSKRGSRRGSSPERQQTPPERG